MKGGEECSGKMMERWLLWLKRCSEQMVIHVYSPRRSVLPPVHFNLTAPRRDSFTNPVHLFSIKQTYSLSYVNR